MMENPNSRFEVKNFKEFVSSFTREDAQDGNIEANRPAIILPQEFLEATLQMCKNTDREVQGIFLAKKNPNSSQDIFIVEGMLNLGYGSGGFVKADSNKLRAAFELLKQNPNIRSIDYHTHPLHLGQHYHENFSDFGEGNGGDANALTDVLNKDNKYMHVLMTPTHFLTYGLKLPQFKVALSTNSDVVIAKLDEWQSKFNSLLG